MPNKRKPSKKKKKQKVNMQSADITADRLARLRDLLPEAFTEGKVDFDRLREALGEEVEDRPERYSFTWAGKRDAMRLLQVPSRATLVPCPEESVDWDSTQNLFIEGENLEVLKLLYKSYAGRVKMIYIDPPYNTGKERIYCDDYSDPLGAYLRMTGQEDEDGNRLTSNAETSGRYHSTWLSMMYPRLFIARQLLREEGVIFVSIDDHEVQNLRLLMNEIFGGENFIALLPTIMNLKGNQDEFAFAGTHEYTLVFAREKRRAVFFEFLLPQDEREEWLSDDLGLYKPGANLKATGRNAPRERRPHLWFPIYVGQNDSIALERQGPQDTELFPITQGQQMSWRWGRARFLKQAHDVIVVRNGVDISLYKKQRPKIGDIPTAKPKSLWYKPVYSSGNGTNAVKELFGAKMFDTPPKPPVLLRDMIEIGAGSEDLVLDFFAGSCTTAQALLELNRENLGNRRFVLVQLPEPTPKDSPARNAGCDTISAIGKERIRRVIKKLKAEAKSNLDLKDRETPEDLGFRVYKLSESNYRVWKGVEKKDGAAYADTMEMFADPLLPGWKPLNVLYEVALKEGYSLTSKIEKVEGLKGNTVYCVIDPEKGQSFRISLDDKLKAATLKALALKKDDLFICRDSALTDEQAANLALQCNLKTI